MPSATMKLSPSTTTSSSSSPYYSTTSRTRTTTRTTTSTSTSLLSSSSSPSPRIPYPPSSSPSPLPSKPSLYSPYTRPQPPTSAAEALLRWAQLKKYRIEVTYGVYVYTPAEKLCFWAVFGLLFVALSGAALLWAARHVAALGLWAWVRGWVGGEDQERRLGLLGTSAAEVSGRV